MTSSSLIEDILTAKYLQLAFPLFFLLLGLELWKVIKQKSGRYRLNDSLTNIATGVMSEVLGLSFLAYTTLGYHWIYQKWHWLDTQSLAPSAKLGLWLVLILGQDFCYYWYHRGSHRLNIGWGGHITHHQSEEYNLSVALRQSSLYPFFAAVFYWPLALIGFPPEWFLSVYGLNLVYQFWIHTREIDKLGWFEKLFNTPSHHRVHHATNKAYLDKNYAGILIIWDKLFGTFIEEQETPRYGITIPLNSWNPFWAVLHYYAYLVKASLKAPNIWESIKLWIKPPDWNPAWLLGLYPKPTQQTLGPYDLDADPVLRPYIVLQFALLVVVSFLYLLGYPAISGLQSLLFVWLAYSGFISIGWLLEQRAWGKNFELLRLFALGVLLPFALPTAWVSKAMLTPICVIAAFGLGVWFLKVSKVKV